MKRIVIALLVVFVLPLAAHTQGKANPAKEERQKQLRKEIQELKARLAILEKELAALEGRPPSAYIGPVKKIGTKTVYSLKVGDKGNLGDNLFTVEKVGDNFATLRIGGFRFYAGNIPVKGLANGITVQLIGDWEVGEPVTGGGEMLSVVRPLAGAYVRIP